MHRLNYFEVKNIIKINDSTNATHVEGGQLHTHDGLRLPQLVAALPLAVAAKVRAADADAPVVVGGLGTVEHVLEALEHRGQHQRLKEILRPRRLVHPARLVRARKFHLYLKIYL